MTTEQAIDALYRIRELQDQQHYFGIGREGIRTDFAGIVSEIERLQQRAKELEAQVILAMANTTQQAMRVEELVAAAERFRDTVLHEHDGLEVNYVLGLFDDSIGQAM